MVGHRPPLLLTLIMIHVIRVFMILPYVPGGGYAYLDTVFIQGVLFFIELCFLFAVLRMNKDLEWGIRVLLLIWSIVLLFVLVEILPYSHSPVLGLDIFIIPIGIILLLNPKSYWSEETTSSDSSGLVEMPEEI
ncbi:MAG: hypothetical protein KAR33_10545 [Candidatus Thorarchaeota archaeon]|nr:hypothetical protein [Candidatus Thorarchaeota archaeon]